MIRVQPSLAIRRIEKWLFMLIAHPAWWDRHIVRKNKNDHQRNEQLSFPFEIERRYLASIFILRTQTNVSKDPLSICLPRNDSVDPYYLGALIAIGPMYWWPEFQRAYNHCKGSPDSHVYRLTSSNFGIDQEFGLIWMHCCSVWVHFLWLPFYPHWCLFPRA